MDFYGLLGEKLSHSLSPEIHSDILKAINKSGSYKLFEIEKDYINNFIEAIKLLKVKGCNVTIPYKKEIIKYLDEISEEAKKIGAINTIYLKENKLYGYNTDYFGFGYMLKENNIEVNKKVVVILGNGGAARAVLYYLLDNDAKKIYIVSRNPKKDYINLKNVKLINYEQLNELQGDILINSTPVGMYPNCGISPVSNEVIMNFNCLIDLIYNPIETKFLALGKKSNKKIVGGLYMLVGQAIKAQEIWQATNIDEVLIREIYNKIRMQFILGEGNE